MNYANMIEEKRLKQGFIIATLISTIVGTFTTGINLFDRISDKRRQSKLDHGQDQKIRDLERRVNEAEAASRRRNSSDNRSSTTRRGGALDDNDDDADDLRYSLQTGGQMVRSEYDRRFAAMGPRFAEGDLLAQTQLQGQIITLQGTVIKLLEEALLTGRAPDVTTLRNASRFAREGTLQALRDQYQRLLLAAGVARPVGLVRRVSSTPALRDGGAAASSAVGPRREQRGSIAFHKGGPLFCPYAEELQRGRRGFGGGRGGCGPCPACGAVVGAEGEGGRRREWNIVKEIVRERVARGTEEVVEIVQDRTYLLTDRFLVKCHRPGAGYACYLCFRHRDRETLCNKLESLVTHVLEEHDIGEYEMDPDIREVRSAHR